MFARRGRSVKKKLLIYVAPPAATPSPFGTATLLLAPLGDQMRSALGATSASQNQYKNLTEQARSGFVARRGAGLCEERGGAERRQGARSEIQTARAWPRAAQHQFLIISKKIILTKTIAHVS